MTSTIAPPPTSSANLIPTSLHIGQQVNIESRTWPGINKPGGHATITKLHYGHDTSSSNTSNTTSINNIKGAPIAIDVKYILGGTEKHIELSYVQPCIELSRGGRSRKVDKKMNVESFTEGEKTATTKKKGSKGGEERKRKTLGDIDKNGGDSNNNNDNDDGGDKGMAKKKKTTKKKKTPPVVVEGDDTKSSGVSSSNNKKKKDKKDKKEEGKQKKKAGSSSSGSGGGSGATKKKMTKSIASYFTATTTATTTSSAKSSTSTSITTNNAAAATTKKKSNGTTPSKPKHQVKYSPNSILAVRAAHAKSYAQNSTLSSSNNNGLFDTTTIGYELPVGGISGEGLVVVDRKKKDDKKKKKKKVSNNSKGQESLFPEKIMEERKKVKTSSSTATATTTKTVTSSSTSSSIPTTKKLLQSNHKTIQSLYKNECVKAQDFVNSMVGSSTSNNNGDDGNDVDDVASSPESCLELKMDSGRMNLFNSLLSEIMFKKGIDSMDIDEMIYTMNTTSTSSTSSSSLPRREEEDDRPFTLLEVKTYLQKLHDENRIFVSWDDGNSGIVYSI